MVCDSWATELHVLSSSCSHPRHYRRRSQFDQQSALVRSDKAFGQIRVGCWPDCGWTRTGCQLDCGRRRPEIHSPAPWVAVLASKILVIFCHNSTERRAQPNPSRLISDQIVIKNGWNRDANCYDFDRILVRIQSKFYRRRSPRIHRPIGL